MSAFGKFEHLRYGNHRYE